MGEGVAETGKATQDAFASRLTSALRAFETT